MAPRLVDVTDVDELLSGTLLKLAHIAANPVGWDPEVIELIGTIAANAKMNRREMQSDAFVAISELPTVMADKQLTADQDELIKVLRETAKRVAANSSTIKSGSMLSVVPFGRILMTVGTSGPISLWASTAIRNFVESYAALVTKLVETIVSQPVKAGFYLVNEQYAGLREELALGDRQKPVGCSDTIHVC